MRNIILQQFKLMLHRRGFWAGMTGVLALVMLNIVASAYINKDLDITQQHASVYVSLLRYASPLYPVFLLCYPFLLLLPFVFAYRKDARLHIHPLLQSRMGVGKYYAASLIVCFLGSFLIFFIPLVLGELISSMLFRNPHHLTFAYNDLATVSGDNILADTVRRAVPFQKLYFNSPHKYNLMYCVFFSGLCGLLAMFVYSISYWIKKYDILLLLPVYILIQLQSKVDTLIGHGDGAYFNCNMSDYVTIDRWFGQSILYIVLLCAALLGFTIISTIVKCRRDQLD